MMTAGESISLIALIITITGWIYTYQKQKELVVKQINADQKRDISNKLYDKKWEMYSEFASKYDEFKCTLGNDEMNPQEFIDQLSPILHELLIVGSPEVLEAISLWHTQYHTGKDERTNFYLMKIIMEMRKDLGEVEFGDTLQNMEILFPGYRRHM